MAQMNQSKVSRLVCIEADKSKVQPKMSVTSERIARPIMGQRVTLSNLERSSSFRALLRTVDVCSAVSFKSTPPPCPGLLSSSDASLESLNGPA
jgi:hypothetical protein